MRNYRPGYYLPTPREIAATCASIRAQWTPRERQRRRIGAALFEELAPAWRPPVIDTSTLRMSTSKPMSDLVT